MAFENVDTKRLIDALNQCKQGINHSKVDSINSNLKSNSIWVSKSKKNLTSSIDKLVETRYKSLEKEIDNYIEVANYIEKYKTLQQELLSDLTDPNKIKNNIKNGINNMIDSSYNFNKTVLSTKSFTVKGLIDTTKTELENNLKNLTGPQLEKKKAMDELLIKIETLMK